MCNVQLAKKDTKRADRSLSLNLHVKPIYRYFANKFKGK